MNPALLRAHARLVPWFARLPREHHPWWMPVGAGTHPGAWGIDDATLGETLAAHAPPDVAALLESCAGSVGAVDARYWVLLEAPPARGYDAPVRQRLPVWLNRLGLTPYTHVTTLRKFRSPELPEEALLDAAHVLADEVAAVPPRFVLAAPNARRTLRALHDVLRDRDHPTFPAIRALLEVPGAEGRMPHQLEGPAQQTAVEAWRLRLPREDQNLAPITPGRAASPA